MGIGRPKGSKNRKYSYDFKLMVVKDHQDNHLSWKELAMKYGVYRSVIQRWVKLYNEGILETGRIQNRGNPYAALHTSKSLTREEKLELENLKLKIENERLKKGYLVKGGGLNKEYVTISGANTRSSKN
ncbi:MAG: transposase [Erysipelotrichaceae bacterium]|nr:transposase [Erysipelotrichaceae bacterium]